MAMTNVTFFKINDQFANFIAGHYVKRGKCAKMTTCATVMALDKAQTDNMRENGLYDKFLIDYEYIFSKARPHII